MPDSDNGEGLGRGLTSCIWTLPSNTDCFRAWGCEVPSGNEVDLARGDGMRGEEGAVPVMNAGSSEQVRALGLTCD